MRTFSNNLKQIRKEVGMTQEQLAQGMFVTRQAVSRWERGHTEPDIATIIEIGKVLNVEPEELIFGRKKMQYKRFQRKYVICTVVSLAVLLAIFLIQLILAPYVSEAVNTSYIGKEVNFAVFQLLIPICGYAITGVFLTSLIAMFYELRLSKSGKKISLIIGIIIMLPSVAVITDAFLGIVVPTYREPIANLFYASTISHPPLQAFLFNFLPFIYGTLMFLGVNKTVDKIAEAITSAE